MQKFRFISCDHDQNKIKICQALFIYVFIFLLWMRIQQNSWVSFVSCLHKIQVRNKLYPNDMVYKHLPLYYFRYFSFFFSILKRYYIHMYHCRIGPCSQHILKPWQHLKGLNSEITTHIIVDHSIMWLKLCCIAVLFAVAYGRSSIKGESLENFRVDLSGTDMHFSQRVSF